MSFVDQIPKHHNDLIKKMVSIEGEIMNQHALLDHEEEKEIARSHDCDCEYCPYQDVVVTALKPSEVAEIEQQIDKLTETRSGIKLTIIRLEGYAKSVGAPMPDDKLLKNQSRRVR